MSKWIVIIITLTACFGTGGTASAARLADFVCYYEIGQNPVGGADWLKTLNVLAENDAGICLGNWSDSTSNIPTTYTNGYDINQGNPTGLVVGFDEPVVNRGTGVMDLLVMGNPQVDASSNEESWYEPGYIEVARETTAASASPNGWADETFYMIKPGNYDLLKSLSDAGQVSQFDPRVGPLEINFSWAGDDSTGTGAADSYLDDHWKMTPATNDLYGYADIHAEGDAVDLTDAIDMDGNKVTLADISYVRIRTVSDSPAEQFLSFSTEVLYVQALDDQPGDFNGDGVVEAADLALLLGNWGSSIRPGAWTGNWDDFVDANELAKLLDNWGVGLSGEPLAALELANVPEPMTMIVITLGMLHVTRGRKR